MTSSMSPNRPAAILAAAVAVIVGAIIGILDPLLELFHAIENPAVFVTFPDLTTGDVITDGVTPVVAAVSWALSINLGTGAVAISSAVLLCYRARWARIVIVVLAALSLLGLVLTPSVSRPLLVLAAVTLSLLGAALTLLPASSRFLRRTGLSPRRQRQPV